MGLFVANKLIKLLVKGAHDIKNSRVLVLGITFKENCPDIRNSGVIGVINELQEFGLTVDVFDTFASATEVKKEYDIDLIQKLKKDYQAIILAVKHDEFLKLNWEQLSKNNTVIFDLKSVLPKSIVTARL